MYNAQDLRGEIDPVLTNFSVGYQDQSLYGTRLFPITGVGSQAGKYMVYDRSSWQVFPDMRAQGTVANEIQGGKWASDTYSVREHSLQAPVFDEEREISGSANSTDADVDPERDAVELITRSLLLGHESKVFTALADTNNYAAGHTVTLVGNDQWNVNHADSTPVTDINTGLEKIYDATRREANYMVMSRDIYKTVIDHSTVTSRFDQFQLMDDEAFKKLTRFNGTLVIVDSVYNAADNIDDAEVITDFWSDKVWIGLVDPTPGQRTKTFGKTFEWAYPSGTRPTDRWREEPRKADLFRVSWRYDIKVVCEDAGYLISDVLA